MTKASTATIENVITMNGRMVVVVDILDVVAKLQWKRWVLWVLERHRWYGLRNVDRMPQQKKDKEVMIMKNRLEKMGNELTTMLGFENDTVIAYWQAFEGRRFIECEKIYHDAF